MKTLTALLTLITLQAFGASSTFKLYNMPNVIPDPSCDVYTQMDMAVKENSAKVTLTDKVAGFCDLHVDPNKRIYHLAMTDDSCGSRVYTSETEQVVLADNRLRLCDDIVPALIVFEEKGNLFYSYNK